MRRANRAREARHFFGNGPLVVGLAGIAAIVAVALFGPQLAAYDPNAWRLVEFGPCGEIAVPPIPPGPAHPLGTDALGRDLLARLLWGARLTLAAVLLAVVARAALGLAVGLAAGWRRGPLDTLLLYATNAVTGFPQLMLALLLVVLLKDRGFVGFVVALAAVGWGELAQFVRRETIRLRASPHVEAAHALGATAGQILRRHILRPLAPQLAGLVALEAGAVLLLLAELGFISLFISGGTSSEGAGPRVLDRAPEWGQMLAGARSYTFVQQWIAFIPALVVGAAVLAFNLFGEGVRAAIDPFGPRRLAPRTLDALGRGALALLLVGVAGFGVVSLRSGAISLEDGLGRAREAAARVEPRAELAAAVVVFRSDAHALGRPAALNYYFKVPGRRDVLFVGFPSADANAIETRPFYVPDGLATETMRPLGDWRVGWREALASAEGRGGAAFRGATRGYIVQVVLEQQEGWPSPVWRVIYQKQPAGAAPLELPTDAVTGATEIPFLPRAAGAPPPAPTPRPTAGPAVAPTPLAPPLPPEAAAWLRDRAVPFATDRLGSGFDDLRPLGPLVGDARIVALGEAASCDRASYAMRARLTEFLIAEGGFSAVALDVGWSEAERVDEYIRTGRGNSARLLRATGRGTAELLQLVEWARERAARAGGDPPIGFYGLDPAGPHAEIDALLAYVGRVDPAALDRFTAYYAGFRPYAAQSRLPTYAGGVPPAARAGYRADLQRAYDDLAAGRAAYEAASSPRDYDRALHSARLVLQAEEIAGHGTDPAADQARQRFMAENAARLLERAGPGAKLVLWSTNLQVGLSPAADGSRSLGGHLRERYGAAFVNVAFTFHSGTIYALRQSSPRQGWTDFPVPPPPADSYEAALDQAGLPRLLLDLRALPAGPEAAWLAGPRRLRQIGNTYDDTRPDDYFSTTRLPEQFDAIVYSRETTFCNRLP